MKKLDPTMAQQVAQAVKLLWIAMILLLPIVGMVLYFLIGRSPADAHA